MTRPWTADDVLELMRGYQPACVLAAAVDLDVFGHLSGKRMSAGALASQLGTDPRATIVLLDALAALEFLTKEAGEYGVPPQVADVLTDGGTRSIVAMARHQANCLRRWVQLPRVVQSGKPADKASSIRGEAADQAAFIGAMHNVSGPLVDRLVDALRPLTFRHLLDIGGASGTWTIALLNAAPPTATATLFDLPDVIPLARQRLTEAGLAGRVTLVAGDFYTDPLPAGADFAWLGAIIHQNSREQNRDLFRKIHAALDSGGAIIIRDIVMDESRIHPESGAMFAVNMLVGTPLGGTYTFNELREDLATCGFDDASLLRRGDWMDSIIRAAKR